MKKYFIVVLIFAIESGFTVSANEYPPKEMEEGQFYEKGFIPGAGYTLFIPSNHELLGYYQGLKVKYIFYKYVDQNSRNGPAYGDLYCDFVLLNSKEEAGETLFLFSFGGDTSFEQRVFRQFFIPYFGFDMGILSQRDYGVVFTLKPSLGLHLISTEMISLDFTGGYIYPFEAFDDLAGWNLDICLNVAFW